MKLTIITNNGEHEIKLPEYFKIIQRDDITGFVNHNGDIIASVSNTMSYYID